MSFYESHRRRPTYYSGPPQGSRPFYKRSRDLPSKAVLRVQGRRPQYSSPRYKSPPVIVFLLKCRPVVAQCVERLQHFNSAAAHNFNAAVSFPSGACGSRRCHSVASPPRGRPWRLSPLAVLCIISMIVLAILYQFPLNTESVRPDTYRFLSDSSVTLRSLEESAKFCEVPRSLTKFNKVSEVRGLL